MRARPIVVLVEGNQDDVTLDRKAILDSGVDCKIKIALDGLEACRILFEESAPLPTLILLELDLPKLDGFDVLARIRASDRTRRIPVIIFTALDGEDRVHRSFDLGANSFVQRDPDLNAYETRLRLLLYYWIAVNKNVNS